MSSVIDNEIKLVKNKLEYEFVDSISNNLLKSFVLNGSKFIRSTLSILYLKTLGCEITENVYKILCAGELIHSSSLLHDDVIDNAEYRRNNVTIAKEFSPKVSILSGDFLLSVAIEKLLVLKDFEVLDDFKNCVKTMIEAEIKQFFLRGNLPTEDDYLEICKGKTAILFATMLSNCSKFANISNKNATLFGELFGVCFQIKNDLEKTSAEIDLKNEIFTAIDIFGIEKTRDLLDNYKEEMRKLIKNFPDNVYKKGLEDLINLL